MLRTDFSFQEFADSFINETVSTVAADEDAQAPRPKISDFYPNVFPLVDRTLWYIFQELYNTAPEFEVWRREGNADELKKYLLFERRLLQIFLLIPFQAVDPTFFKGFFEFSLCRAVENADLDMLAVWISEALVLYSIDSFYCVDYVITHKHNRQ